jgi:thioredoxin-related protein
VRVDIHNADAAALLQRLDFRYTPTFILFDETGNEAWRSVGSLSPDEVNQQLNQLP